MWLRHRATPVKSTAATVDWQPTGVAAASQNTGEWLLSRSASADGGRDRTFGDGGVVDPVLGGYYGFAFDDLERITVSATNQQQILGPIEVGGEESDAGERVAKRLEHQQLVVYVAAEHPDRHDAVGWACGCGIERRR